MNKQEIESKVAALIQPEGERKHGCSDDIDYHFCLKCKADLDYACTTPCPHPDPIAICDNPEDKAAYEASMGMAIVWLRDTSCVTYRHIMKVLRPETCEMAMGETYKCNAMNYALYEATPLQIWEIILKAKEKK